MRVAIILAGVAAFLWVALFFTGLGLVNGVVGQHAPGYPNAGQIEYYVALPACVALALLGCAWLINVLRRWYWLQSILSGAALIALPGYLLFYSGGV